MNWTPITANEKANLRKARKPSKEVRKQLNTLPEKPKLTPLEKYNWERSRDKRIIEGKLGTT